MRWWPSLRRWLRDGEYPEREITNPLPVELARLEVVGLGPNDVLILRAPGVIRPDVAERLQNLLQDKFPGRRCLVLGDGLTLDVLREKRSMAPRDRPVRSHEELLALIRKYGETGGPAEMLAEIDSTLFDLYEMLDECPPPAEEAT